MRVRVRDLLLVALTAALCVPVAAQKEPLRVFIRAGDKTHGPAGNGLHDYPTFLTDWTKLLTARGAVVQGALRFPTADELARTDVLVIFKGDGGTCSPAEQHGEKNFSAGLIKLHLEDGSHAITKGLSDFELDDEAFFLLRKTPEMHVLATAPLPSNGEVTPQVWIYETTMAGGQPFRSFVWMQGHKYASFEVPASQNLILRGIAWAGKRDVTLLQSSKPSSQ